MSTPTLYGATPPESRDSSADFQLTTTFLPLRGVAARLLVAFGRWQIRRLDRRIAAMRLDDRLFHQDRFASEISTFRACTTFKGACS
jgi:hypothetical protein